MGIKVRAGIREQLIGPGEYKARVIEIREGLYIGKRKIFEFRFQIVEGEHKDSIIRGFINAQYETFSNFTKLHQWFVRATGETPEPGEQFDTDQFLNKVLRVKVENKISKKTHNSFSNVTEILGVFCDL